MPLHQLYPKPDEPTSFQPQVDIIALHGLNPRGANIKQHAFNTWTKPSGPTGRLWLRDDLPKYTPESRIFLYEYNSSLIFGDRNRFFFSADELLEDIRNERIGDERRPIVFLAHSLGGVLAEQAIVNSFNNKRYTSIWLATSGLAFFGTPHNGGRMGLVTLASVAARIASTLQLQPENDVPEAIRNGSLYTDILKEHWRQRLLDFDLYSFWEGDERIVTRESASFGVPGDKEAIIELKAAHSDLCRFDQSEGDQVLFKRVRIPIQEMYEKALSKSESVGVHSQIDLELESRLAALRAPV
ncbi:hypothetical protein MMC20_005204 [Loxospora ochrophaea]|nr:hypothetical protein [Loxospora ochrophaea]